MFKRLIFFTIMGGAALAAWNSAHPQTAAAADLSDTSGVQDSSSVSARATRRLSIIGTSLAHRQIRASVEKTERELAIMAPMIRKTGGQNGRSAVSVSLKINELDSLSLASLAAFHPVASVRFAMSARGYLDVIRQDISDEVAAR